MKQETINKIKKAGNILRYVICIAMFIGLAYGAHCFYHDYYKPYKKVCEYCDSVKKYLDSDDWRVRDDAAMRVLSIKEEWRFCKSNKLNSEMKEACEIYADKALQVLIKDGEAGHVETQYNLGNIYFYGQERGPWGQVS